MAKLKVMKQNVLEQGLYQGKIKKYFCPHGKDYMTFFIELKLDDGTKHDIVTFINNRWDYGKFVQYSNSIGVTPDENGELELEQFIGNKVQVILDKTTDDAGNVKNEIVDIAEWHEIVSPE